MFGNMKPFVAAFSAVAIVATTAFAAGNVDYGVGIVTGSGAGVAPPNAISPAHAKLLAREAAIAMAQRDLAATINGVQVDAETTVENMMTTSVSVRTRVSGLLRGARVVDEKYVDGACYVTMEIPIFGASNSLASTVFERPAVVEKFPEPVKTVEPAVPNVDVRVTIGGNQIQPPPAPPKKGQAYGGYTGLIIDCRGMGLKSVMSPVVKNANGTPIYGYKNLDYDRVVSEGMADYSEDFNDTARAGSNPLVVKAITLDDHNGNPVVSVADANRILIENDASGFLDNCNVVFIR